MAFFAGSIADSAVPAAELAMAAAKTLMGAVATAPAT